MADQIKWSDIIDLKKIGEGFYGVSNVATVKNSFNKKVVRLIKNVDEKPKEFEAEIGTFKHINHDNVLSVQMVTNPDGIKFLVIDFSEFGSLYDYLHIYIHINIDDVVILNWVKQFILGIQALHDKNIVHGNLGTRNLFLFDHYKVLKICLDPTKTCGAPISAYTAPEILKYKPATEKSDVYSFGIILWELLSRKKPFDFDTTGQRLPSMILDGQRPNLDEIKQFNEVIRCAIEQCWNEDPNKRPTLVDLIFVFKYDYRKAEKLSPF